ncbi:hypothetical protein DDB_G0283227 [Dictyostelium discoideum AX4]|uniref:MRH domain-containing protein n=1 Tax=Dictyostelium discoideum TaxID=44689 RepID=Q54RG5_DICDI|nr:hypothetical protein DDB_G0283227 [Dictyostelium discoideum AX4]EAL65852.1 hypothetical protein DDB_G0283227 [Dictyostelium discoideum AX4]|eukprot:XP_639180.1 hypothetical protein DDB_G0283227 [Dictyostelium discoideum AX4]
MNYSNLILSINVLLLFFITTLNCQSIFKSIIQTRSNVEIELTQPLYLFNITSLDNLYYNYDFNGTSVLNSCIFNSNYFSLNLSKLKNVDHSFPDHYSQYEHRFSICSNLSSYRSQSGLIYRGSFYTTGNLNTEEFEFGKFGFDDYALKLRYNSNNNNICGYSTRNYYFQCDENQEFNFTAPSVNFYDCYVNVYIKTKYVCPYKNTKRTSIKYSLVQPNILRFTLDENSSKLISINNGEAIEVLPIKPIINSCENNGDIITVNGVFFKIFLSAYILNFESKHILSQSNIISFNSTTLVVNSTDYVENYFFISLFDYSSDRFPILKPQQQMKLNSWCDNDFNLLFIDCTNCIGAKTIGLPNNYTKYSYYPIQLDTKGIILSGIYLEAPIYPYRRSGALPLPTNFQKVNISGNEIFGFYGNSIVSISGHFIPKIYDNQAYIIGKLEFLNGTICILDYNTLNNSVLTQGKFNIPSGYGNGNFSIYIKDKLVHSNLFTYQPPVKWISSITQNQEKVQLHLSFPFSLFPITSIKYNDKNGNDLDYTLIEPNIISFTLNTYSTNVLSFNNDYHIETLTNGLNFRPIIYRYSIENGIIIMEGLFVSKLSNYKFYLDDSKIAVSSDQVTYFDRSRLSLVINQFSYVYVYSDDYSYTRVPDLTITSDQDQLLFTCSNCLGGYININEPQSNQDSQFSQTGTIVKQFNTNTIFNKYKIFTFTKDSKTLAIQPPLPKNLTIDGGLAQFSTFSNNTILVSSDFLLDKYNGYDYTDFQLQFDNGTIYSPNKQILSKSVQNYIYQLNIPFAYGSGNFSIFITLENGRKFIINSTPFNYPTKPIINSISKIKDGNLKINGDGFLNITVVGSFKTTFKNIITGLFSDTIECHSQIIQQNQNIICQFTLNQNLSLVYSRDAPITIQIKSSKFSQHKFETVYTQTFFNNSNSNSNSNTDPEMLNNDISLHSVFSKLVATLFIIISILFQ